MAGRVCLVKSVIQSSAIHSMLVYRWPTQTLKDIDNACRNFIWTGSVLSRPYCSVSWDIVCTPKEKGGLGVRSLRIMNESLLAKIAWKILKGTDFGFSMLRSKYLNDCLQPAPLRVLSSVWMGARRTLADLVHDSFCSIGDGTTILFWWDDWLGYRLADRLSIPFFLRPFLTQHVSDYLFDGVWHFTDAFITHHVNVVIDILTLPLGGRDDIRYWKPSITGEVTSKAVYQHLTNHGLSVKWGHWIWSKFLPVRRSIISWRAIRGRLPTYDALMRYGFPGPNVCLLCFRNAETIDHIFWTCSFAYVLWQHLFEWFGVETSSCPDLNSFLVFAMETKFSPQFSNLWNLGVITIIWQLWMVRNAVYFEGKQANSMAVTATVKAALLEPAAVFDLGRCYAQWGDESRGKRLGVVCRPAAPRSCVSVSWWPPLPGWIKANTDGAAAGCPGAIAAGGVFRDAVGAVRGCFHLDGGHGVACEAELLAAITAVKIASSRGWRSLWLETDSTYVEHMFSSKSSAVPWRFANDWRHTLRLVEEMDFRVSHIFREGNQVADILASSSIPPGWWPQCIPAIADAVARDLFSPRFHRVV